VIEKRLVCKEPWRLTKGMDKKGKGNIINTPFYIKEVEENIIQKVVVYKISGLASSVENQT